MSLETHKMLALSTGHLSTSTRQTMDRLAGCACEPGLPVYYSKGPYGWFVHVAEDLGTGDDIGYEDLKQCLLFARSNGFDWIMFDVDVESIEELHNYEE